MLAKERLAHQNVVFLDMPTAHCCYLIRNVEPFLNKNTAVCPLRAPEIKETKTDTGVSTYSGVVVVPNMQTCCSQMKNIIGSPVTELAS
jgi:hypothetical protein